MADNENDIRRDLLKFKSDPNAPKFVKNCEFLTDSVLGSLNLSTLKALEKLMVNVKDWQSTEIPGEKNAVNEKYIEWMQAEGQFDALFKSLDNNYNNISLQTGLSPKVIDPLNVNNNREKFLVSALKYCGADIRYNKEQNNYEYIGNLRGEGFPYHLTTMRGLEYITLDKPKVDTFLKFFLDHSNPKRISLDGQDMNKLSRDIFKTFVNGVVIGTTNKRDINRKLLDASKERFSENSPEWQAFVLRDNPDIFLQDSQNLITLMGNMVSISNEMGDDPNFSTIDNVYVNGKNRCVELLEDSCSDVQFKWSSLLGDNMKEIQKIQDRYINILKDLKRKNPNPNPDSRAGKCIKYVQRCLDGMNGLIKGLNELFEYDNSKPKDVKINTKALTKKLCENLAFNGEGFTIRENISWIDKEFFTNLCDPTSIIAERNNAPEEKEPEMKQEYSKDYLLNLIDVMHDLKLDNIDMASSLDDHARLYQLYRMVSDTESSDEDNPVRTLYNQVKEVRGEDPKKTKEEIFALLRSQESFPKNTPVEDMFAPYSIDEMITLQDKGFDPAFADMPYVYIDKVSKYISNNPNYVNRFLQTLDKDKPSICEAVFKDLKKQGIFDNVTAEERVEARDRWSQKHFMMMAHDDLLQIAKDPAASLKNSPMNKVGNHLARIINESNELDKKTEEDLKNNKKAVVASNDVIDKVVKDSKELDDNEEQSESEENKPKTVPFSKIYPRETPQFEISKKLKPYNVKAGVKFMGMLIGAFAKIEVLDPKEEAKHINEPRVSPITKEDVVANEETKTGNEETKPAETDNKQAEADNKQTEEKSVAEKTKEEQDDAKQGLATFRMALTSMKYSMNDLLSKFNADNTEEVRKIKDLFEFITDAKNASCDPIVPYGHNNHLSRVMQSLVSAYATGNLSIYNSLLKSIRDIEFPDNKEANDKLRDCIDAIEFLFGNGMDNSKDKEPFLRPEYALAMLSNQLSGAKALRDDNTVNVDFGLGRGEVISLAILDQVEFEKQFRELMKLHGNEDIYNHSIPELIYDKQKADALLKQADYSLVR